jgi:hypothetical protein
VVLSRRRPPVEIVCHMQYKDWREMLPVKEAAIADEANVLVRKVEE